MEYKQFIPDELSDNELIASVENSVVDNLRASLADDDDPTNDDHAITISHTRGRDASGRSGLYIVGTTDSEPDPYPELPRDQWEIKNCAPTKNTSFDPTDFEIDNEDYLTHMLGKVQG